MYGLVLSSVHWAHGLPASPQAAAPTQNREVRSTDVNEQPKSRPTKQVIVIRRDLRMRRGKEIAQGAHAATAWLAELVIQQLTPDRPVGSRPAFRGRTDLARDQLP